MNRSRIVGKVTWKTRLVFFITSFLLKLSFQAYVGTDDKLKFTHKGNIRRQLA